MYRYYTCHNPTATSQTISTATITSADTPAAAPQAPMGLGEIRPVPPSL